MRRGGYHLTRPGKTSKGGALALGLDADLSVAGLTLSMAGLGAEYRFDDHSLAPHLTGMGLVIKRGPVQVGASFLNMGGEFSGSLTIVTPGFALHALGQFKMIENMPSIFAFGSLDMPLGGPVFFFVEGLSAGIGIHRSLHMPDVDRIAEFPLIDASNTVSAGETPNPDPLHQLQLLHECVRPELAQYFIAAGIKFNWFRIVQGNVLAVAQFGNRFELDLIGIASAALPPDRPAGVPAMANIALTIEARFSPTKGTLRVDGRLDPRSYVYSPLCHLSGGFAFHAWFNGDRAGDFVLSVGGYYVRAWTPPDYYPVVPRIEMKFQVTDEVYLKGNAYFALTPSVAMAGGGLHVQVGMGNLHAWADFSVDFLIGWEPYHYDAQMHIGIGAEWKCFHTHASAGLHVWGPDFSGIASVDWWIFSFDIELGSSSTPMVLPITFEAFKQSFLDIGTDDGGVDDILGLTVAKGQHGQVDKAIVVNPSGLELRLSTRVPADHLKVDGGAAKRLPAQGIGIPPMWGISPGKSTLQFDAKLNGKTIRRRFEVVPVEQAFPAALWAPLAKPQPDTPAVHAVGGLIVTPLAKPTPGRSLSLPAGDFRYPKPEDIPQIGYEVPWHPAPSATPNGAVLRRDLAALGLDMTNLEVPDGTGG